MRRTMLSILVCFIAALSISAQTTEFTYQGSFKDGGNAANGNYDFEFKLFNLVSGGAQQGSTNQRLNVAVANGIFTVSLDFGVGTLPGSDRFLDIAIRTAGGGAFTPLSPRQKLTSAPYSVRSLNSATADVATNATQLGGVAASQYVVTTDPRMTNERAPTAGSANYIQNQDAATQASSNFRISGTGTANFLNATTHFNLNNNRIISAPASNLFVGFQTGQSNTTGNSNSFFGASAGANNTIGGNNSFFGSLAGNTTNTGNGNAFFGYSAGRSNTTGGVNSFFGFGAGEFSTTANYNSFFGFNAGNKTTAEGNSFFGASSGENNTTGMNNSFFGVGSGQSNTTGSSNSFVGRGAGLSNTTGNGNSFVGVNTGMSNTEGFGNSFVGSSAGLVNTTGNYNTFLGDSAGFSNTTAGSHVFVGGNAGRSNTSGGSNTFVGKDAGFANTAGGENAFFGAATGQSNTTGGNNTFVGATAGLLNTTGGNNSFVGHAAGYSNTSGVENAFFGLDAGRFNQIGNNNSFFGSAAGNVSTGNSNSFFGRNAGVVNTQGNENSFFGTFAGGFNSTGSRNTAIGFNANVGSGNLQYATAIGADSVVSTSNTIALGRSNGLDQVVIPGSFVANLPAGDADYIQNRTSVQASSNFNISGNGFVGGNVGIGTTTPSDKLQVNGGITATGMTANSFSSTSGLFLNASAGGRIALRTAGGSTERMTILDNGNVGIGTTTPTALLEIPGVFRANSGIVQAAIFNAPTTSHLCYNNGTSPPSLVVCGSAAEYAPSIDNGTGFPETADLVSLVPSVENPYGDTHGPFVVQKTIAACDQNLLGFVLNPESGADGPKLNDHYLPLAIYGYFPAKVTLENGPIKRGDPITSSSKAGFGMRATNACKIVGYALEDADKEGKIQVFAHLSDHSAPVVTELQSQIEKLRTEKTTEVESLKARLAALEQVVLSTEKSNK